MSIRSAASRASRCLAVCPQIALASPNVLAGSQPRQSCSSLPTVRAPVLGAAAPEHPAGPSCSAPRPPQSGPYCSSPQANSPSKSLHFTASHARLALTSLPLAGGLRIEQLAPTWQQPSMFPSYSATPGAAYSSPAGSTTADTGDVSSGESEGGPSTSLTPGSEEEDDPIIRPDASAADGGTAKQEGDAGAREVSRKLEEVGGPKGPEPTRYGDWEKAGRCYDF